MIGTRVACVLLLAAAGAASCSAAEVSPAFAAAPLISRLRGGGMPQFWANQQDLKNAPERWCGGFAKLRAMCGGASEEQPASRGKASRLAGSCVGVCRARVLEDDTRWCMRECVMLVHACMYSAHACTPRMQAILTRSPIANCRSPVKRACAPAWKCCR